MAGVESEMLRYCQAKDIEKPPGDEIEIVW
jgi:hypothetical protein